MELPAELEKRYQTLLARYPIKRSALVPMALYGQDLLGYVSDALIAEIARRLDLNDAASHGNARLLFDDPAQARRQVSRAGVHQRLVHAARRIPGLRVREKETGNRQS